MFGIKISQKKSNFKNRHIAVVSLFITAASFLVVLTTFAINMLTATGDFNRLLVQWSQHNSNSNEWAVQYFETGGPDFKEAYLDAVEDQMYTGDVINELMKESPNADVIFNEFNSIQIHPNEITGLIRIFTLFSETDEIKNLKETWMTIQRLNKEKQAFIDSLFAVDGSRAAFNEAGSSVQYQERNINNNIREMISGNSGILLMLKRYSLWFTVLLGILIVLIGVVFTVRGIKQINKLHQVLSERDYLATFPELNQSPVLNVTLKGELGFINQSAQTLFPELKTQGIDHPFLKELKSDFKALTNQQSGSVLKEVQVDGSYYQQVIHYLSEENGIHVHSIDITKLKQQQLEISKSLNEKNMLLGEVHHRVKNNMAVISGLLELQEMMGEDPNTALSESRSRIKSMAIVHELLYQADSFSEINTDQYMQKIADHLRLSLSNIESVQVKDDAVSPNLNINQAIPLGLLINEIAFYLCQQDPSDSNIDLTLEIVEKQNEFCLRISSLLQHIENPLKATDHPSLRMNLIKNLLEQIDAEFIVPESEYLIIEIRFNPSVKKGSSSSYL